MVNCNVIARNVYTPSCKNPDHNNFTESCQKRDFGTVAVNVFFANIPDLTFP